MSNNPFIVKGETPFGRHYFINKGEKEHKISRPAHKRYLMQSRTVHQPIYTLYIIHNGTRLPGLFSNSYYQKLKLNKIMYQVNIKINSTFRRLNSLRKKSDLFQAQSILRKRSEYSEIIVGIIPNSKYSEEKISAVET